MDNFLKGEILNYSYSVKRGKPMALLPVKNLDIKQAQNLVKKQKLFSYTKQINKDWSEFWVFKYPEIEDFIKQLPEKPISKFDHFINGLVFGYSIESIIEFIREKC